MILQNTINFSLSLFFFSLLLALFFFLSKNSLFSSLLFLFSVVPVVNQQCFNICFEIVTNWNTTKFFPSRVHWLLLSAEIVICQMLKIITRDATRERNFYSKLYLYSSLLKSD